MIAIRGGKIITKDGDVFEDGSIVIDSGKILSVGQNIPIPAEAKVLDASNYWVAPGLIDCNTHIGLKDEPFQVSRDGGIIGDENELSDPVTAHLKAFDGFYPHDMAVAEARKAGITTCFTGPGSVTAIMGTWPTNLIGGTGFAFKTKQANTTAEMAIPNTEQMKMAVGEDPVRYFSKQGKAPVTRMAAAWLIRDTLRRAMDYSDKLSDEEEGDDYKLNALLPLVRGKMKARVQCHRADDIFTAIRICEEFGLDYVLDHVTEGHLVTEMLKEHDVFCVLGPMNQKKNKTEVRNHRLDNPAIFEKAGLRFCLSADTMSETKCLPWHAGLCTAYGLPWKEAFAAITTRPARMLGIDGRTGSLEPGKDADIGIFTGDPLSNLSRCVATIIDGKIEYQEGI